MLSFEQERRKSIKVEETSPADSCHRCHHPSKYQSEDCHRPWQTLPGFLYEHLIWHRYLDLMIEALLIATYVALFGSSMGFYHVMLATKEKGKKIRN